MKHKERILEVLLDIQQDMRNDAAEFAYQPFNGRAVAEYNGKQGAAIAGLANIIHHMLTSDERSE